MTCASLNVPASDAAMTAGAERDLLRAVADVRRAIVEFPAKPIDVDETIG